MSLPRIPLTVLGRVILILGLVTYGCAALLDWTELAVLAAGCLVGLALAAPFAFGRLNLEVERTLKPNRVTVGSQEGPTAVLEVRNPKSGVFQPRLITEMVDGDDEPIRVPSLKRDEVWTSDELELPTNRRRVVEVGPALITRRDPLHLLSRESRQTTIDRLWVHPEHRLLPPLPVGFAKDLEGPTSDTSPAGDVAFHALREYRVGDNFRHIHWLSSAKTGKTMVRHYVDNRRPVPLVMLDTDTASLSPDCFEVAVSVAASVGVSALHRQLPVSIWAMDRPIIGRAKPGGRTDLLDRLTEVDQIADGPRLSSVTPAAVRSEIGTSATIIVTGSQDLDRLVGTVAMVRRHGAVVVVRVWEPESRRSSAIPRARVIDVETLDQFVAAWTQAVRR